MRVNRFSSNSLSKNTPHNGDGSYKWVDQVDQVVVAVVVAAAAVFLAADEVAAVFSATTKVEACFQAAGAQAAGGVIAATIIQEGDVT